MGKRLEKLKDFIKREKITLAGTVGFGGSIASLLGLIITLIFFTDKWEWQFTVVALALIFNQAGLTYVVMHAYRHKERAETLLKEERERAAKSLKDEKDRVSQLENSITIHEEHIKTEIHNQGLMAEIFHNYAHKYRSIVTDVYLSYPDQELDHYRTLKEFLVYMMANVKEIFDITTGDSCAVCVKVLQRNDVRTLVRDSISERRRSQADGVKVFDYRRNTAFRYILDEKFKDSFYLSNNMKIEKVYENANPYWRELYNSTLVVPIRIVTNEETHVARVIGFICVDNFKGGFTRTSIDLLASFADLLFHMWHLIDYKATEQAQATRGPVPDSD